MQTRIAFGFDCVVPLQRRDTQREYVMEVKTSKIVEYLIIIMYYSLYNEAQEKARDW